VRVRRRNVASDIALFWRRIVLKRGLESAVRVEVRDTPEGPQTIVTIDDTLPYLPFRKRRSRPRFIVTTESTQLLPELFGEDAPRRQINRNAGKRRGRVVFLIQVDSDGGEEELAAISFHVDKSRAVPVVLRTTALRTDSQERHDLSVAGAGWLLAYLVEVSRQATGMAEVGADTGKQGNPQLLTDALGFRPRPTPTGMKCAGEYIAFRPPRYGR
jgi:hypothetical protein